MINESGLNRTIELLNADLTYIAIGTGATPSYTATVLSDEYYRAAVSESLVDGLTLVKELFLDENTGNTTITEVAVFCGSASATTDSGEIFASFGASIDKNSSSSLTISFETEVLEV